MGPDLVAEGMKVRGQLPMASIRGPYTLPQWLLEHFQDPQLVVAGSQMPPPQLNRENAVALTTFLLSLQNRDLPGSYLSPAKHLEIYRRTHPDMLSGKQLFRMFCSVCHDDGTYGRYDKFFKKFIPAIRGVTYVQIASRTYIEQNVSGGHAGTIMPAWGVNVGGLSNDEIQRIAEYLGDVAVPDKARLPADVIRNAQNRNYKMPADVSNGRKIFTKQCAGCHEVDGSGLLGPSLTSPVFQKTASDGFIFATIAYGRQNTAMPAFLSRSGKGLSETDIANLVAYVRELGEKTEPGKQNPAEPRTSSRAQEER